MEWKVGQQVYCLRFGEGFIKEINTEYGIYKIEVQFAHAVCHYTSNGCIDKDDATPMLYPAKPEIIVPKWQPKEGEWCWFWDEKYKGAYLAKFSRINESNFYISHADIMWKNCAPFVGELPEHLKEVQP
jgi:hypothetical protein